jgi:hypothetical protein
MSKPTDLNRRGFLAGLTGLAASLGLVKPVKAAQAALPDVLSNGCVNTDLSHIGGGLTIELPAYLPDTLLLTVNGQTRRSEPLTLKDGNGTLCWAFNFDPCCPPLPLHDCDVTITE